MNIDIDMDRFTTQMLKLSRIMTRTGIKKKTVN